MRVRTIKKYPNNRGHDELTKQIRSLWLGWRDSNPRMPGPKPGALPLGHIPFKLFYNCHCTLKIDTKQR